MILFGSFILISMVLVALGLYRTEHTELSLVGFIFIFLLSMVVIGDNLTYQTGETVVVTNTYGNISGELHLLNYTEVTTYDHSIYQDTAGFFTTHNFGYLLAILSVIGMIGTFVSIRTEGFFK